MSANYPHQSVSSGTPTVDLEQIAAEFEKQEAERLDTLGRIEKRHASRVLGDESHLIAHYKMMAEHYGSRARVVRAALSALSGQTAPPCRSIPEHCDWPNCVKAGHRYFDHACVDRSALSSASTPENEGSEQQNKTTKNI